MTQPWCTGSALLAYSANQLIEEQADLHDAKTMVAPELFSAGVLKHLSKVNALGRLSILLTHHYLLPKKNCPQAS